MGKRFAFADDDPVLARLETMPGDELALLRIEYGRLAQVKAAEQTTLHARIARITRVLRSRRRDRWEVTDHAVVRYLERVKGVNIGAIRREICELVTNATHQVPAKGEAVGLRIGRFTFVVVRDQQVVTVHDPLADPLKDAMPLAGKPVGSE